MTRNILAVAAGFGVGFLTFALANWALQFAGMSPGLSATAAKGLGALIGGLAIALTAESGKLNLALLFGALLLAEETALALRAEPISWLLIAYNLTYPLYAALGAQLPRLFNSAAR